MNLIKRRPYIEECSAMNKSRSPLENIDTVHIVEKCIKKVDVNKGAESGKTKKKKLAYN